MPLSWSLEAPFQKKKYFLENLSLALTKVSCEYENIMVKSDVKAKL